MEKHTSWSFWLKLEPTTT